MNRSTDILLVEDDPGDVRLALSVLRAMRIEDRCMVVSDGEQAMDFLRRRGRFAGEPHGEPRLILLDLKMPRVDGFDFLEKVKQDPQLGLVPVIALTSSREERDVVRAYRLGVNGYVVKGIDFDDYRTTLRALAEYWLEINEGAPDTVERELQAGRLEDVSRRIKDASARPLMSWLFGVARA